MLTKDPPEKIFIDQILDEVNTTTESIDLDSSLMSVDDFNEKFPMSEPLAKISKANLIIELKKARQTISIQQKELDSLQSIRNIFCCEKKRGTFTYNSTVDNLAVSLLCQGETSNSIARFFETISFEF